jgi:hypothetical protein
LAFKKLGESVGATVPLSLISGKNPTWGLALRALVNYTKVNNQKMKT